MNTQKLALGGLAGGIIYFLLGYVFYELLLKDFFANNGMSANMDAMVWWAMIAGNLVAGLLLTYILSKAGVATPGRGATMGFIVGLLMGLSFDLIMYGLGQGISKKGIAADVAVGAVMSAIAGAVIAWILGSGKKVAVV